MTESHLTGWEEFTRRHPGLMVLATLLLAVLATIALLSHGATEGTVILYEGF